MLLVPHSPRTLCYVGVSHRDTRREGGGGAYPPLGIALVRAATLVDKGPALSRADLLNPPPLHYGRGRDAGLGFAVTLEPRDGPYVVVVFGERGRAGDFALVVWHSKPLLVRGGAAVWLPDGVALRDADDADEELAPDADEEPDPDPHDQHRPAVARSAAAVAQHQRMRSAAAEAAAEQAAEPDHGAWNAGRQAAAGAAAIRDTGFAGVAGRPHANRAAAVRFDDTELLGAGGGGGGGGGARGGAGGSERRQGSAANADPQRRQGGDAAATLLGAEGGDWEAGGDGGRRALMQRIGRLLEEAEMWQLQAIAKILD